uniref:E3 ubiquitin-protein ligase AMFR n=1 Tax=Lygus hesperus TaxID=30085 RepID=A0A0A9YES1_LYGHE
MVALFWIGYFMLGRSTPVDMLFTFLIPTCIVRFITICVNTTQYIRNIISIRKHFAQIPLSDIPQNEVCVICRDELLHARRLGCGHLLHPHCLLSLIKFSTCCPVCRQPLSNAQNIFRSFTDLAAPDDDIQSPRPSLPMSTSQDNIFTRNATSTPLQSLHLNTSATALQLPKQVVQNLYQQSSVQWEDTAVTAAA